MEEEVANFQKALSEDEIKRLMLEEGLSETQRCLVLLKKPELDQQSYMFRNCRGIFTGNESVQKQLLPKVLDMIATSSEGLQIEAGLAFNAMLREILILDEGIVRQVHAVACKLILTWSPEVLHEWRQVFILSMRGLSSLQLKNALEKSLQMCDKTQPLVTRISGAYLLGKVVKHFTPNQVPIGWPQRVTLMTQDFNFEVRNEIAHQFKSIFKHLSTPDLVTSKMLDRYLEVLTDSEEDVQSTALLVLPWVLDRLDDDQIVKHIQPILKKICCEPVGEKVSASLLYQIGRISSCLHEKGVFSEFEPAILTLIQDRFIDTGSTLTEAFVMGAFKGLFKEDSDAAEEGTECDPGATESAWRVNQRSICYNLPALAMFLEEKSFFVVLFPHL